MIDDVEFDYEYLMQKALRSVMREVLTMVADIGDAPGEHHFYIEFITGAPGVSIPDHLRQDYPERMTIVLQHQFEDLTVDEDGFAVTLWFKGKEARLEIPFAAVSSFADPSVQFGLRYEGAGEDEGADAPAAQDDAEGAEDKEDQSSNERGDEESSGADIVSLDAFRKK